MIAEPMVAKGHHNKYGGRVDWKHVTGCVTRVVQKDTCSGVIVNKQNPQTPNWRSFLSFHLPPTAKGPIEFDDTEHLIEFGLDDGVFGGEKLLLLEQDFVVARLSRLIALESNLDGVAVGFDGTFLLEAGLGVTLARNQRIGNLTKSGQHGGLILQPILLAHGASLLKLRDEAATLKDGSGQ